MIWCLQWCRQNIWKDRIQSREPIGAFKGWNKRGSIVAKEPLVGKKLFCQFCVQIQRTDAIKNSIINQSIFRVAGILRWGLMIKNRSGKGDASMTWWSVQDQIQNFISRMHWSMCFGCLSCCFSNNGSCVWLTKCGKIQYLVFWHHDWDRGDA